jgi:hypothetical protein
MPEQRDAVEQYLCEARDAIGRALLDRRGGRHHLAAAEIEDAKKFIRRAGAHFSDEIKS